MEVQRFSSERPPASKSVAKFLAKKKLLSQPRTKFQPQMKLITQPKLRPELARETGTCNSVSKECPSGIELHPQQDMQTEHRDHDESRHSPSTQTKLKPEKQTSTPHHYSEGHSPAHLGTISRSNQRTKTAADPGLKRLRNSKMTSTERNKPRKESGKAYKERGRQSMSAAEREVKRARMREYQQTRRARIRAQDPQKYQKERDDENRRRREGRVDPERKERILVLERQQHERLKNDPERFRRHTERISQWRKDNSERIKAYSQRYDAQRRQQRQQRSRATREIPAESTRTGEE